MVRRASTTDSVRVLGKEWHLYVTRNMSFWHQSLCAPAYYAKIRAWGLSVPFEILFITEHGTLTHNFWHSENWNRVVNGVSQLFSTRTGVIQLKARYKKHADLLLRRLKTCKHNLSAKTWDSFCDAYSTFTIGLNITAIMGRVGLGEISK